MTQENLNKQILITSLLLIAVILLFYFTNLDVDVQSYFYNFEDKSWLIDVRNHTLKYIFYDEFKKLYKIFAICILFLVVLSFFRKINILEKYKKGLIILCLATILVPSLAAIKNVTNMPCPKDTIIFGGEIPEVKIFDHYPKDYVQEKRQRCWPAGHATMGFSLMALYFLFKKPRNQKIALGVAFVIAWLTGGYKMLIGHHFLSHTLVTMLLAWLVILIIAKFVLRKDNL